MTSDSEQGSELLGRNGVLVKFYLMVGSCTKYSCGLQTNAAMMQPTFVRLLESRKVTLVQSCNVDMFLSLLSSPISCITYANWPLEGGRSPKWRRVNVQRCLHNGQTSSNKFRDGFQ
jgi:hypothetical protein